ncbi:MAG: thiamine phosphate synthase [Bacilli bacterium]
MKFSKKDLLLYAVTDRSWSETSSLEEQVQKAIDGGITFLQLREKNIEISEFLKLGKQLRKLTNKYQIPYVINDDIDVAVQVQADGIHIGQDDCDIDKCRELLGESKIIGVSVQTVEQAILAQEEGADYLGVGAIFTTNTKLDASKVSLDLLKEICMSVSIPVVAIGGITTTNIEKLAGTGINGVAVVSEIFSSDNIVESTKKLLNITKKFIL